MKDEPELLVPISELHRQRDEMLAQAKPAAPRELTGWKLWLWRVWVFAGAITIVPVTLGATLTRHSDPGLFWGSIVVCGIWLVICYATNPLLRDGPQR